jgi:hypothetical protein
VRCLGTVCTYPDAGRVPLQFGPPYLVGTSADAGFAAYVHFTSGATLSEPMTNAQFTNFGHLKALSDQPDAGPTMSGGSLVNETDFLGITP